jgi:hypothetical protein
MPTLRRNLNEHPIQTIGAPCSVCTTKTQDFINDLAEIKNEQQLHQIKSLDVGFCQYFASCKIDFYILDNVIDQ